MFNIGGGELIVIMVIALVVLGPKRLPDAARQIGKTMGDLRRLSTSFQDEVRTAIDSADDPNRISDRRNVLTKDHATPVPTEPHPERTEPLVAAPAPSDEPTAAPASRPPRRTPLVAAEAPPAPTKAKAPAAKRSPARNGTKVAKVAKGAAPKAPRRPKP
jgi:sec-independent protein translocase protein TatB